MSEAGFEEMQAEPLPAGHDDGHYDTCAWRDGGPCDCPPAPKGHYEGEEGCPVLDAIENGDGWDGGSCPLCGAVDRDSQCFEWVADE